MNDPHVEALYYRVKHANSVDYDKALPLEHVEPQFSIRIEKKLATIVMSNHYSTVESARELIEPFLRAWELESALFSARDKFCFEYKNSDVIDRNPSKGTINVAPIAIGVSIGSVELHVGRSQYPKPPARLTLDSDVELMFECYNAFYDGRRTLSDAAYFCLTVLERAAGKRKFAARYFGIAERVFDTLGRLTGEKGGREARKAKGAGCEFTGAERAWIEAVMKAAICRAAEVAYDSKASAPQITMVDLPPLG